MAAKGKPARFADIQVRDIRKEFDEYLRDTHKTRSEIFILLAREYEVDPRTIERIVIRKTYPNVV